MEQTRLNETLRRLAGHLVIDTEERQRRFETLTRSLRLTHFLEEHACAADTEFSFARSDIFADEAISRPRAEALAALSRDMAEVAEAPRYRVFTREVPVRDPLLHASVPSWAVGARLSHTVGPFVHRDGRRFWFDFYFFKKLITLYVQGTSEPALLFEVTRRPIASLAATPLAGQPRTFSLNRGSIWINARVLAPTAPASSYVGLTIFSGQVSISVPPTEQDDDIIVPGSAVVNVRLNLEQASVDDINPMSPFGGDARNLQLDLPSSLAFRFSANGRTLDEVGDAQCVLYGQRLDFAWSQTAPTYNGVLRSVSISMNPSAPGLGIVDSQAGYHTLTGSAPISRSAWSLAVATIDIESTPEAAGTGAMLVQTRHGLVDRWPQLRGGAIYLDEPIFLMTPGTILLFDQAVGNPHATQDLILWEDDQNPYPSTVRLAFPVPAAYAYVSSANGTELFSTLVDAEFRIDRPVQVNGEPPAVRSQRSLLMVAVSNDENLLYLYDDDLRLDAVNIHGTDDILLTSTAFALTNALFRVSLPRGCLLFGVLNDELAKLSEAFLFTTFGLQAYLPTLPDPYAANLGVLQRQIRGRTASTTDGGALLVCLVGWRPAVAATGDTVAVSFHFSTAAQPLGTGTLGAAFDTRAQGRSVTTIAGAAPATTAQSTNEVTSAVATFNRRASEGQPAAFSSGPDSHFAFAVYDPAAEARLPDYEERWDKDTLRLRRDLFALLDVSTNADLFGVSFDLAVWGTDRTHVATDSAFPIQAQGMDVVSTGRNVKAFTVPQISWEPVVNLTVPQETGDPPYWMNYYPDDGGPTRIINNSDASVPLAPLPLTDHIVDNFAEGADAFAAMALMTLPFGLKSLALLQNQYSFTNAEGVFSTRRGTEVSVNAEQFPDALRGAMQLKLKGGQAYVEGESDMFVGRTVQLNNVRNVAGVDTGASTLGASVTTIFNGEFSPTGPDLLSQRGVPLTRIDLSGYGATTFSNWLNPEAVFAQTSQAKFDVLVGRCAHEIIQVKSVLYPWGIRVVRTITVFRVGSGYVYRVDSGWKAESSGQFDFRYFVNELGTKVEKEAPFEIHPGLIKGLYNVTNIVETEAVAKIDGQMTSEKYVDDNGDYVDNPAAGQRLEYSLQPVFFDADIDLAGAISGFTRKRIDGVDRDVVPSKGILGYVQLAPMGMPITAPTLQSAVIAQLGSIGGPIDCEVDLASSGQKMRLNRFDFNNARSGDGSELVFVLAGRGSVLLPSDGSWSMVKHERGTGEVTPVPANLSVPVIREGRLIKDGKGQKLEKAPGEVLLRIANPSELLRAPTSDTVNYGLLQSTGTQKALFLTPSFEAGRRRLLSKTPPLFADAFRIVNSKSVFPNVGGGDGDVGEAISLIRNGTEFIKSAVTDGGSDVWELMDITGAATNLAEQGFGLLKQVAAFDLPNTEFELIDVGDGNFRIYIEYEQKNGSGSTAGNLDFDINSMANDIADTWKSRMGNIGLVMDLAGIERLMTIRGSWDAKKGSDASYPQPELVFSKELQPVIDILEILQQLQGGDYAGAVANGLKLAMSNKAGTWEYKFEASKEIPVLRFPVPDAVYNDPNTPFKLEAGLKVGAYFNAALKVTNDANELLPSAGGLLGFYGRLSVMCVSLSAATVYAIGQVNLDIAADTKIGPSLRMKFGFGAQIVIGLPVAGNVSVLFVVGVELFAADGLVEVTAFMLFEGHAEILGGIVSVTIRIEAKGTVSKKALGSGSSRTDLACQVTFGLDISIFLVINISFETSWSEQRQIA